MEALDVPRSLWWADGDCTVIGHGAKSGVNDFEGVNNTIVGVNNMGSDPPGPVVREAMQRKIVTVKFDQ
jgi:hypothetical protein